MTMTTLKSESPAAGAAPPLDPPVAGETEALLTRIRPSTGWRTLDLRELWRYRELFFFLVWRDVKIRYKQTLLGAAWAVLQPALMMIVFTIFLGRMAGLSSGDLPYPVFVYAGLLPWMFFATSITNAGNSVIGSERLITKIYFPRLAIPFAAVGAALFDFFIAFSILAVLMAWYGIAPGWSLALTPLLAVLLTMAGLGTGSLLAALNVSYRDFRYVIPFLVQIWMFATPTIYMQMDVDAANDGPRSAATSQDNSPPGGEARQSLPLAARVLLAANPMTGLIGFFRAAVLGGALPWTDLARSAALITLLFLGGCYYFRRVESSFADII
ncbi:MAG: ABC transporter permease [Planctomycetes bacterium]|nr:ABC transporter permease [Planctomycetota bacterium]